MKQHEMLESVHPLIRRASTKKEKSMKQEIRDDGAINSGHKHHSHCNRTNSSSNNNNNSSAIEWRV
jgi:hypothetical protein